MWSICAAASCASASRPSEAGGCSGLEHGHCSKKPPACSTSRAASTWHEFCFHILEAGPVGAALDMAALAAASLAGAALGLAALAGLGSAALGLVEGGSCPRVRGAVPIRC